MAVYFDEEKNFFTLMTENTEYQMKVDRFGVLRHLWYGERVGSDMEYLLQYPEVSFSGSIYEAENDRSYSLNTQPLEYSCEGNGDFRVWAVSAEHSDGTRALDLRYESAEVRRGKYSLSGLPAVYADENDAETLAVTLRDAASDIRVTLLYGVLEGLDVITRAAFISNEGKERVFLDRAASVCLDLPRGDWEWVHFHGRHAMERVTERSKLVHGVQECSSVRGASSHQQNPAVLLCSPTAPRLRGAVMARRLCTAAASPRKYSSTR